MSSLPSCEDWGGTEELRGNAADGYIVGDGSVPSSLEGGREDQRYISAAGDWDAEGDARQ